MEPHPSLKKAPTEMQSQLPSLLLSRLWQDSKPTATVPLVSHSIPNTQFSTCHDKQLAKGLRETVTKDA